MCGLSKRYVFNRVAVDDGYDVVVTGHNLDDEAATLLGNVLRWHDDFLARQRPVLPATGTNQVRKVKPLYRLSEREMAAYCVVRGIDYVVEECPLVDGNTGHELKEILSALERPRPGAKAQFLFGFLDSTPTKWPRTPTTEPELGACDTLRHADHRRRCARSAASASASCRPARPRRCRPAPADASTADARTAAPLATIPEGPPWTPTPRRRPCCPGTDAPLAAGELVVLIDRRGRRYLVELEAGGGVAQPRRAGAARRR